MLELIKFSKPTLYGDLSYIIHQKVDCELSMNKYLSFAFHKKPMGGGSGRVTAPIGANGLWKYPPPGSVMDIIIKSVCSR